MEENVQGASLVDVTAQQQEVAKPDLSKLIHWGNALHDEGRYDEAARAFAIALDLERGNWQALIGHNRAIRRSVPRWHCEMLHDEKHNKHNNKTNKNTKTPKHQKHNNGTGSGLLSMMSARAGA